MLTIFPSHVIGRIGDVGTTTKAKALQVGAGSLKSSKYSIAPRSIRGAITFEEKWKAKR